MFGMDGGSLTQEVGVRVVVRVRVAVFAATLVGVGVSVGVGVVEAGVKPNGVRLGIAVDVEVGLRVRV
jgi:hypothetical protein